MDWHPGGVTAKMAWLPILFGQSEADVIFFVELGFNSVLFGSEVGSFFGPERAYISLSWESTQYLVRGGFKFLLGRESTHCLTRSGPISCRVGSRLKSCFQPSAWSCARGSVGIEGSFYEIPYVFMGFYAILCPRPLSAPEDSYCMIICQLFLCI